LQDKGFKVTAVDFAPNCLDEGVTVPFVQGCLWDLPDIRADWGYCTDVMEHIPTEKVGDVLKSIAERVKGCYFAIATRDDSLGWIAGKKLHLSILQPAQWRQLLGAHWKNIDIYESDGGVCIAAT
jgi:2-polyprenyl-3-methyl-5-hydroxy-6-metoxy-1,4-benzoquinol methylase